MELVHQVRRFAVSKGDDGISKVGVGTGDRLGGDVDGTGLAACTVEGEGSTSSGGETRAEDLAEVDGRRYFQKIESDRV